MPVVVVANPKGGVGKSTLSTQLAGYWASRGHAVVLGDADRQQSSRMWLSLRPPQASPIATWSVSLDGLARPPRGTTHLVLDTPAGLKGRRLDEVMRLATRIVVPLQASVFDMHATQQFLVELADRKKADKVPVGVVGMRVDERTIAAEKLRDFVQSLGLPVLGYLRHTQNYVHLAAQGLTLFDVAPARVARDIEQWRDLCEWVDAA